MGHTDETKPPISMGNKHVRCQRERESIVADQNAQMWVRSFLKETQVLRVVPHIKSYKCL